MATYVVAVLNKLIDVSMDRTNRFRTAAEGAENPQLRILFTKRAEDCAESVQEFTARVNSRGGELEEGGSVAGAVRRAWLNLKGAVSKPTDLAILEECERGEDVAKASYRKALEGYLPPDVRDSVQRQCDEAIRNHDQIRDLREQYRDIAEEIKTL